MGHASSACDPCPQCLCLHVLLPYSTAPNMRGCLLASLGLCGGLLWGVEVMVQQDGQAQLCTRYIAAAVQHTL